MSCFSSSLFPRCCETTSFHEVIADLLFSASWCCRCCHTKDAGHKMSQVSLSEAQLAPWSSGPSRSFQNLDRIALGCGTCCINDTSANWQVTTTDLAPTKGLWPENGTCCAAVSMQKPLGRWVLASLIRCTFICQHHPM